MPQKNNPYIRCAYRNSGFDCFGRASDSGTRTGYCHVLHEMPKDAQGDGKCPFYKSEKKFKQDSEKYPVKEKKG